MLQKLHESFSFVNFFLSNLQSASFDEEIKLLAAVTAKQLFNINLYKSNAINFIPRSSSTAAVHLAAQKASTLKRTFNFPHVEIPLCICVYIT